MKAITNILSIIVLAVFLSQKTKRPLVSVIPTAFCGLMAMLYLLSIFHVLSAIDYISLVVVVAAMVYYPRMTKHFTNNELFLHPSFLAFVLMIVVACMLNQKAQINAWDDINYWASTVRSLFERDGLEGKYYTVATAWGDYPLGQQLIEWWFVHSFGCKWNESLLLVGYYVLIFSYMASIYAEHLASKKQMTSVVFATVACIVLSLIHYDDGNIQRLNADVLLATAYGGSIAYILRVTDSDAREVNAVDSVSIGIQLIGITLIKSIGIFWSSTAILLYFLLRKEQLQIKKLSNSIRSFVWYDFAVIILPVLTYFSWKLICKLLSRQTYLVNTLLYSEIRSGDWYWAQIKHYLDWVFFKTKLGWKIGDVTLGFSPAMLIFLPCIFFWYLHKHREYNKQVFKCVVLFVIGVSCCYILVLLYSYQTMFSYEPEAFNSVPRYVLPCVILVRVVLWHMYINWKKKNTAKRYEAIIMSMILLCAYNTMSLPTQAVSIIGGYSVNSSDRAQYEEKYEGFTNQIWQLEDRLNASICYISDELSERDRIYLCYLANGTAVNVFSEVDPEKIIQAANNVHATHVVVCYNSVYSEADYQMLMESNVRFEFGRIYEIIRDKNACVMLQ